MARLSTESCKDCANLEDRRDVDCVALCALHHGPQVSCPEFKPKDGDHNAKRSKERFCVNCANYEEIDGVPFCAKDHRPGVACGGFNRREEVAAISL
jgi:hypothetical protein